MTARNRLLEAPPYAVERGLARLGGGLRTARLRRNLTIEEVAEKIGAGPRAVSAAEKGNPSTGVAVFAALLWTYGLLDGFTGAADPARDAEGQALARAREPSRAGTTTAELDDDF